VGVLMLRLGSFSSVQDSILIDQLVILGSRHYDMRVAGEAEK